MFWPHAGSAEPFCPPSVTSLQYALPQLFCFFADHLSQIHSSPSTVPSVGRPFQAIYQRCDVIPTLCVSSSFGFLAKPIKDPIPTPPSFWKCSQRPRGETAPAGYFFFLPFPTKIVNRRPTPTMKIATPAMNIVNPSILNLPFSCCIRLFWYCQLNCVNFL